MPICHNFEMPNVDRIRLIVGGLMSAGITVSENETDQRILSTLAVYVTKDEIPAAVCSVNIPLANFLGASLSMIPSSQAAESSNAGQLPKNLRENFSEVMNVAASLFTTPHSPRMLFRTLLGPDEPFPTELVEQVQQAPSEYFRSFQISVQRYGTGQFNCCLFPPV